MPPTVGSQHHAKRFLMPFIIAVFLFISAAVFGLWAFMQMQDYKNNVDQKIAVASEAVKKKTGAEKDKQFAEEEKNPLKHFKGPDTYGSVDVQYSKKWSGYVDLSNSSIPLNAYFHPDYVPGIQSGTAFALRIQVVNQSYDREIKGLEAKVNNGKVKVTPFRAAKVPNVLGSRVVGEINVGQKNTRIYLPLRDKTLEIEAQADQYVSDLDNIILPSLTFSP